MLCAVMSYAQTIDLKPVKQIGKVLHSSVLMNDFLCVMESLPENHQRDFKLYDLRTLNGVFIGSTYGTYLLCPWEDKFIIVQERRLPGILYNVTTKSSNEYSFVQRFMAENKMSGVSFPMSYMLYYQNDFGYVQMRKFMSDEAGTFSSKVALVNFADETWEPFPVEGVLHAISPDKEYLLIDEDENDEYYDDTEVEDRDFSIYQIDAGQKQIGYGTLFEEGGDWSDADYGGHFVGNENILIPCGPNEKNGNYWLQRIGEPAKAVKLNITLNGKPSTFRFSPNFRWGFGGDDYHPYLVDATPLRDWLMTHNLLFKETTAKVTDTHIRVREKPNLQAKHMGFLEQGETVKVLDRSGPKETIDPWGEHPWYRIVRESDGLSGWCFGAFLDLAEEQGELRYEGEGMVTVYEE